MELVDRYLKSVRSCLPEAQKDDIIRELSENLRSQIEDREATLDRPLQQSEIEAILSQHGHPLIVASRYRHDHRSVAFGRQWIGPVLFPFYVRVLSFNLGLTGAVIAIVWVALFATGKSVTLAGSIPTFLYQFLIQFVIITTIFALADRHWAAHPDRWAPRNLKHPWHPAFAMQIDREEIFGPARQKKTSRVSRFDSVAQFVSLAISIIWLRVAQHAPFIVFGPAALFIKPAPIWQTFYWPVVIWALAGMVQAAVNLLRPDWVRLRDVFRVAGNLGWLILLFFLLRAGHWVEGSLPPSSFESYQRTIDILNQCCVYTLIVLAVLHAYKLVVNLRSLLRPRPPAVEA
jgi:hypothetical protein